MIRNAAFDVVHDVERSSLRWNEHSWFVHVIPESANTYLYEVRVERTPPFAHFFPCEIGKDAVTGPYFAHIHRAVGILHKIVFLQAFVIGAIARKLGDVEIGNGD